VVIRPGLGNTGRSIFFLDNCSCRTPMSIDVGHIYMKKYLITLFIPFIFIAFSFCEKSLNAPEIIISNNELYNLAYSAYKWPENFYQEDSLEGSLYYENTISIKPIDQRGNVWNQLCTNDIDTARHWSELSSNYSAYYRELVREKETEKFYEFKRVYSIRPNDIILSRIHKCSYLDRSMYDFLKKGKIIGIFNKNNFNQNDVKELIEYLWFVEHYDNGGKVHLSITAKEDLEYIHYIYEIEIVHGDWGVKDIISYIKNTFYIKISNGEITHQTELIKQIEGKQN